ncbi:hypothetical protein MMC07_000267 [Pseudocyphellaria aurata]|nr:hypothetical protein [Pseudocyphellaria aurata]
MSSGFVSGGTTENPVEHDDAWLQAQKDIEETRRRKEVESRQEGGKTLYEVLQQNKAAKQEAFEESIRLKNQFRNLDEDEIEFLDLVLESTRAKEEALKKETTQQVDVFRRQQEEADKALLSEAASTNDASPMGLASSESQWAINARKRKRAKEKEGLKGVKLRKMSSTSERPPKPVEPDQATNIPTDEKEGASSVRNRDEMTKETSLSPVASENAAIRSSASSNQEKPISVGLGLVGYSSDEDD